MRASNRSFDGELLLPDTIRKGLATKILGRKEIYHYTDIDSTNDRADTLAAGGAPEGTLVIAESQTSGRGRHGRKWLSPAGEGIYLSLILRPGISMHESQKITLISAVAAALAVKKIYHGGLIIKWPNDILINKKKLAGILTTMISSGKTPDYVIMGMGMNVNTREESMPLEIRDIATSLRIETGRAWSRSLIVREFLVFFEYYYDLLLKGESALLIDTWKDLSGLMGRRVTVDLMESGYNGTIIGIDREGFLLLRDDEGLVQRIVSGEIVKIY